MSELWLPIGKDGGKGSEKKLYRTRAEEQKHDDSLSLTPKSISDRTKTPKLKYRKYHK